MAQARLVWPIVASITCAVAGTLERIKMADRYSALIKARAPEALREAIERAADRDMSSVSDYARRAIVKQLRADGIDPAQLETAAA